MSKSPRMRFWLAQILNELKSQFETAKDPSISELEECGPTVIRRLLELTIAILAATPAATISPAKNKNVIALRSPKGSLSAPSSPRSSITVVDSSTFDLSTTRSEIQILHDESSMAINSVHHAQVSRCWRRLYTDTSLLIVLADLQSEPRRDDAFYKSLIGRLDDAIVIVRAPGNGRMDMCHDAIARIQEEYVPLNDPTCASSLPNGPRAPYPASFEGTTPPPDNRISKRPKRSVRSVLSPSSTTPITQSSSLPLSSGKSIPRIIDAPGVNDYQMKLAEKPFIVPRYAVDWPACTNWANPQYLRNVGGLGRKVPVETTTKPGEDYTSEAWSTKMMDWEAFVDSLCIRAAWSASKGKTPANGSIIFPVMAPGSRQSTPSTPAPDAPKRRGRPPLNRNLPSAPVEEWAGETHYLAQHDLVSQFPELRGDIIVPDYVYAAVRAPSWFPEYKPPSVDDLLMMSNWIGPKGTITPAHKDPYYNCYVQVVGRKTVWLAPPEFDAEMYPHLPTMSSRSSQSTNASLRAKEGSSSPLSSASHASSSLSSTPSTQYQSTPTPTSSMLSNTSRIPIFNPPADSKNKYPLFYTHVQPHAMSAVLEPGDMLVFPPGWWHAMRSEETSASVSIWF